MIDFTAVLKKEKTVKDVCSDFSITELRNFTNEMIDQQLALIEACTDSDVVFVYDDPEAHDEAAEDEEARNVAWTLGHVIVHITASSEEAAFVAAELARGVPWRGGRSRSEVPWETVTTIEQCRHRLEESRRMRLATLEVWPDAPHLDNTHTINFFGGALNPSASFCVGLFHDSTHLGQIKEIVRQANVARG